MMNVPDLIRREISHRRWSFLIGAFAVGIAVASVLGAQLLLHHDQVETASLLTQNEQTVAVSIEQQEEHVRAAGAALEDATRKQMLALGFNILIVPEEQSLQELHLDGTLSATMPYSYVEKLQQSSIVTVAHLLPMVTKRIDWPEQKTEVILVGTKGEVPILQQKPKKSLLDAVAPGEMVIGSTVQSQLDLKVGDNVTLRGQEFRISKVHPDRGTSDDVTIWVDLATAQKMLGMENLVNGILALECGCEGDRITQIRGEIQELLPGTHVMERFTIALTRAESRAKAKVIAEEALATERAAGADQIEQARLSRQAIETRHQDLAGLLVPLVIFAAALWIGVQSMLNVRQRRDEIGILRAIGLSGTQVVGLFLGKGLIIGLAGAIIGIGLAMIVVGLLPGETAFSQTGLLWTGFLSLILAPLFAALSTWLPALTAVRQDPSLILNAE